MRLKIAVIGAGIAGLSCAWRLAPHHDVVLFEANDYIGGHTHTVDIELAGRELAVDTGFLVFNERTYPMLIELFDTLGVATAPSEMSFSVQAHRAPGATLEWAGTDLDAVFAQRRNLFQPAFLGMLADILRFNRAARAAAARELPATLSLADFLDEGRYGRPLREWYLLPMAAAIWSASVAQMERFPAATFLRFCDNHGLLQVANRPQWYTVTGGARHYVDALLRSLPDVRPACPVQRVERGRHAGEGISVTARGRAEAFDHVVFACHSDEALALIAEPSTGQAALLGAIRYQQNRAVLHTDQGVLPRRRQAWAAWNYESRANDGAGGAAVCVHYLLNRLQPLGEVPPVLVSLNPIEEPQHVLAEFAYSHPVFDGAAIAAQGALAGIQGRGNTWFAGAWCGYGFHEDGLKAGFAVADAILDVARSDAALAA